MRRAAVLALLVGLGACGGGPDESPRASDVPATESEAAPVVTGGPDDEATLSRLTRRAAADQRPGERAEVGKITLFDNPDGCDSGEGAVVEVAFPSPPTDGIAVFCRTESGWELAQGIVYGE